VSYRSLSNRYVRRRPPRPVLPASRSWLRKAPAGWGIVLQADTGLRCPGPCYHGGGVTRAPHGDLSRRSGTRQETLPRPEAVARGGNRVLYIQTKRQVPAANATCVRGGERRAGTLLLLENVPSSPSPSRNC
jgi:hypothetical protein